MSEYQMFKNTPKIIWKGYEISFISEFMVIRNANTHVLIEESILEELSERQAKIRNMIQNDTFSEDNVIPLNPKDVK